MKIKYDKETDILYIQLKDVAIDESEEDNKGVLGLFCGWTAGGYRSFERLEINGSTSKN